MGTIFVRPSRDELRKVDESINMMEQFIEILDERSKGLSSERNRLQKIISDKEYAVLRKKLDLSTKLDRVYKRYGLRELRRLSMTSDDNLRIFLREDSILGVPYSFPTVAGAGPSYMTSEGSFLLDSTCSDISSWLESIADLSRYKEAEKTLSSELKMVRRKLNVLRNLVLKNEYEKKKKIKHILEEKERSAWVLKKLVVEQLKGEQ